MSDNELTVLRVIADDGPVAIRDICWNSAARTDVVLAPGNQIGTYVGEIDKCIEVLAHRGYIEDSDGWRNTDAGRQALRDEIRERHQTAWEDAP